VGNDSHFFCGKNSSMNQEKIKQIIEPILKQENVELVDLKLSAQDQSGGLKVLVEKDGGISVGLLANQ